MTIKEKYEGLLAPDEFWGMDAGTMAMLSGGCGPGQFGDRLVPDTLWRLSVRRCCQIHDIFYSLGRTMDDKKQADREFLFNMLVIVERESKSSVLRWLRSYRAMSYYRAVADAGGKSYKKAISKFERSGVDV